MLRRECYMLFKKYNFCVLINKIYYSSNTKLKSSRLNNIILEMSRDRRQILEVQQKRLKIKHKGSKYIPGTVNLQVLGSGAPGAPSSIYLFTDHTRYLFNCGEGTQRLAHEHKIKLARLEHIFLTRIGWDQIGGLPGLGLTLQDAGVPELTLHGSNKLDELFQSMRKFVVLKNLKINTVYCEHGGEYDDSILNIKYVLLKKKLKDKKNEEQTDNGNISNDSGENDNQNLLLKDGQENEDAVISYICKLKPRPGSLNLEKCVEKGVPPGPLLGQLKNGIDVVLQDGSIVYADDVRNSEDPGSVFIFIDVPNENYLESLQEAKHIFKDYQITTNDESKAASLVIHFSPQNIIDTKIYQDFIESFIPSTSHLILNSTNQFSGNLAAHRMQWQLNLLNPRVFPFLGENTTITNNYNELAENHKKPKLIDEINSNSAKESCSFDFKNNEQTELDRVKTLAYYHLRPKKGFDYSFRPSIEPKKYIEEMHAVEGFTECLENLKETLSDYYGKSIKVLNENDYPEIIFLGTGSCIPNKTRNVSSILLHTTEDSCILLDCGEGTVGQIIRFYGTEKANEILKNLKMVYISHLHADHHIGLIGILLARQKIQNVQPFLLLAPKQILPWLHFYDELESISKGYSFVPNDNLVTKPINVPELHKIGITSLITCPVQHCPHSYGISIEIDNKSIHKNNLIKITYSGDTMPCNNLLNIGKNSTILIHEATMEDELIDEAKFKLHSTVSQALEQGKKMNAKYILLTHFSQRYAKLPRIKEPLNNNVGIAFDNMKITLNDLDSLHLLYPVLKLMFNQHYEEMEQKTLKRTMREERKRRISSNTN